MILPHLGVHGAGVLSVQVTAFGFDGNWLM
jgi:hypothetical protein